MNDECMHFNQNKVAIVHDWLTGNRGGEKVLEVFCELFPEAPIYTLLYNMGTISETLSSHHIHTSFIDKLPFKKKRYRHFLPLFPTAIEQFNLKEYVLVLSSSPCVAKGIIPAPDSLHISICIHRCDMYGICIMIILVWNRWENFPEW